MSLQFEIKKTTDILADPLNTSKLYQLSFMQGQCECGGGMLDPQLLICVEVRVGKFIVKNSYHKFNINIKFNKLYSRFMNFYQCPYYLCGITRCSYNIR